MVAMVLLALSSRLQPGEHHVHYSHGRRESTHSEEFFSIREIVRKDQAQLLAINSNRVLQPSRCILCHGGLNATAYLGNAFLRNTFARSLASCSRATLRSAFV
jgi:hypothetical protein